MRIGQIVANIFSCGLNARDNYISEKVGSPCLTLRYKFSYILGCLCFSESTYNLVIESLPPIGISSSSIDQTRRGRAGTRRGAERERHSFLKSHLAACLHLRSAAALSAAAAARWALPFPSLGVCVCVQCHVPQDGRTERQAAGSERTSDGFFSSDVRRSAAPLRTETAVAATEEDHITSSGDGGPFHALTAHVSERTELGMKGGRGYTIYTLPASVQGRESTMAI